MKQLTHHLHQRVKKLPWTRIVPIFSVGLLCIFLLSMILTYGPIVRVEAYYQYNKLLHDVFKVDDLRGLILPQFEFANLSTNNPEFGMQIPSLYLDEPIVFNVNPQDKKEYDAALKKGIAHALGTDLPGYSGLGYYFAHSSQPDVRNQYNAIFYLLGKLENGAEVFIWHDKEKFTYKVVDKQITQPNDVSFLDKHYDRPTIVLQTCWPPGTTQQRMLVFAELQ